MGLAAFGAHALKGRVAADALEVWKTASSFHLLHSVALAGIASSAPRNAPMPLAAKLMVAGMALFSGSLYLLVLTDVKKLGAVTPIGGLLLMAGWVAFALDDRHA